MTPLSTRPADRYAALGGTGVIVVTGTVSIVGAAAILALAARYGFRMEAVDWVLLGLVLALTIGGGVAMARFVRLHGAEIGEARFDTSHADDPPQEH